MLKSIPDKIYEIKKILSNKPYERNFTHFIKNYFPQNKELTGFEIGTNDGYNAFSMFYYLKNLRKLICIDPFYEYIEDGVIQKYSVGKYLKARELLSEYDDKLTFIKKESEQAIHELADNSLDFGYIDGNHSYEYVKKDIELYSKKIKKNGVLGGHDFSASHFGVAIAVFEYAEKNKLDLHGSGSCWWFIL